MTTTDFRVRRQIKIEYAVVVSHTKISDVAKMYGLSVAELKTVAGEVNAFERGAAIRWSSFTEQAARIVFDHFVTSRLNITRFASRYGYPAGSLAQLFTSYWPEEYAPLAEVKKLKTSTSTQGANLERRLRDTLVAAGWWVLRSPASKGAADLLALRDGEILLVQAKRSGALPPREWNNLMDLAEKTGGRPVLAENPYPGAYFWWELLSRKEGRGSGEKIPYIVSKVADTSAVYSTPHINKLRASSSVG